MRAVLRDRSNSKSAPGPNRQSKARWANLPRPAMNSNSLRTRGGQRAIMAQLSAFSVRPAPQAVEVAWPLSYSFAECAQQTTGGTGSVKPLTEQNAEILHIKTCSKTIRLLKTNAFPVVCGPKSYIDAMQPRLQNHRRNNAKPPETPCLTTSKPVLAPTHLGSARCIAAAVADRRANPVAVRGRSPAFAQRTCHFSLRVRKGQIPLRHVFCCQFGPIVVPPDGELSRTTRASGRLQGRVATCGSS